MKLDRNTNANVTKTVAASTHAGKLLQQVVEDLSVYPASEGPRAVVYRGAHDMYGNPKNCAHELMAA